MSKVDATVKDCEKKAKNEAAAELNVKARQKGRDESAFRGTSLDGNQS